MNRYDEQLRNHIVICVVLFILVMLFGFSTNERLMGLQIGLALAWICSSISVAIGLLFRD
jgi:hypothetical protein